MGAAAQGADASQGRWTVIPRSLCLVTSGEDILLMKRGPHKRVFPGRYNGVGGHLERDEDAHSSALREIYEETGVEAANLRLRGLINIDAGQPSGILLLVYTAEALSRKLRESDEGSLEWVPLAEVYQRDLVEDFPYLLPRLFGENASPEPFAAHVSYNAADELVFRFFSPAGR